MAQGYSKETAGVLDGTLGVAAKADGQVYHAQLKRIRATFDLSLASVAKASGDTNVIGKLPRGSAFAYGVINASATMGGTATIAIGPAASPGKYKSAAIFTAAAPTLFGNVAASSVDALTDDETVVFTIAAAALPGAGVLEIDLFYSSRS